MPNSLVPVTVQSFTVDTVQTEAAKFSARLLAQSLEQGPVFLLLSGGSAIAMYQILFAELASLSHDWSALTVTLFDERYVPAESTDSNETQLKMMEIVTHLTQHGAHWISYLADTAQSSGAAAAKQVAQNFASILEEHPTVIVFAGIGDDGHTSGLLPTQNAEIQQQVFQSQDLVEYYRLPDDTPNPYRERLTTTPAFIAEVNQVVAYATGAKKLPALQRFLSASTASPACPATYLRTSEQPVILITDQELPTAE